MVGDMSDEAGRDLDPERVEREREKLRRQEPQELPKSSEERPPSSAESPEGEEVWLDAQSSQGGTQSPQERRSWWRRLFGG